MAYLHVKQILNLGRLCIGKNAFIYLEMPSLETPFPTHLPQWLPMEWLTVSVLWPHNKTCGVVWITLIYVIAQEKKGGAILPPKCVLHETRYSQHDYSTDVWSPSVACRGKIESFSMKKSKRFTPFAHSFHDQYELSIKFFKIGALLFWSLFSSRLSFWLCLVLCKTFSKCKIVSSKNIFWKRKFFKCLVAL